MKQSDRGPFSRIRWFCADGTILPPEPYACRDHGGGRQHGEYSEQTKTLRENGYLIAKVLAALTPQQALADEANHLKWILLERHLFEPTMVGYCARPVIIAVHCKVKARPQRHWQYLKPCSTAVAIIEGIVVGIGKTLQAQ